MIGWLLLIHLVVCAVLVYLVLSGKVTCNRILLPTTVAIPVFGFLILVSELYLEKRDKMGEREIGLETLTIQDAKYRRIEIDQGENQEIVVPLEEAILINDPAVRRKLMLEILHDKPQQYIDLLKRTRLSSDVEMTHYATTTMMEVQSEFEKTLQEKSNQVKESPKDIHLLNEYRESLVSYIESGLISGNVLTIYREHLNKVLLSLYKLDVKTSDIVFELIDNQIELGQQEGVTKYLSYAKEHFDTEERYYKLLVKYYRNTGNGDKIQTVLNEMKEKQIYLSDEGKRWFAFWNQEER